MKNLNEYVIERLKINKGISPIKYNYHPKDFKELRSLIEQLLDERGKDADLNNIDVSNITAFYENFENKGLFEDLDPHNIKIDKWNVSNVKDMRYIFCDCKNFNCNLENWDVSNVEDMNCMFIDCKKFIGQGLDKWNVSNVKDMAFMFDGCYNFNCNLSNWNVSNVENMKFMFCGCEKFTGQGLENWKPLKYPYMNYMFDGCTSLKNKPSWYKG